MLPARAEIKSVEDAFGSFAVERHVNVVSHQRPGERDGMSREMRSPCQLGFERSRVKSRFALALHSTMLGDRILLSDEFSDRIAEIALTCDADVAFDNFRFTAGAKKNQCPWMCDELPAAGPRDVDQVNRLSETTPRRHNQDGAIAEEGGV